MEIGDGGIGILELSFNLKEKGLIELGVLVGFKDVARGAVRSVHRSTTIPLLALS